MERTFGLKELGKLTEEIKVKKGDVRTIKVVLAVTGVSNTVVTEAQSLISGCKVRCASLVKDAASILEEDSKDEAKTVATINQVRATRQHNKESNAYRVSQVQTQNTRENSEIKRLEKILKSFA